ncbi:hypothetical protein KFK09_001888 [Dendrobium nobile]|uniref:Homeobox domain-containing protein n=1 Tax=Dendrobium nobile TaxID=94219 RepID=A0A8T3CBJ0_DENNO|nr:hypothetical protein KFK09_001888 [Dendrobium nobile]
MTSYAYASSLSSAIRVFWSRSNPNAVSQLFGYGSPKSSLLLFHSQALRFSSLLDCSRRRKNCSAVAQAKRSKPKKTPEHNDREKDEIDEDAFEALFSQLEEDLKTDVIFSEDEKDEITEDDLVRLEQELDEALCDEELDEALPSRSDDMNYSDDDEELQPKLKNWQLRRLAYALKIGRRKASIKNLSSELGLERAHVLELLREPPPNLVMMCASLPEEVAKNPEPVCEPVESSFDSDISISKSEPKEVVPVHVMQTRWSMQKRLKKVQLITLERVYARTKRPTNAMISSIVHVTNLPWKRVVKWFEDKRLEDGVPVHREPFHRSSVGKTI